MPETTTNYSIDKLVYNCLNKFSKDNCYLTPNHILYNSHKVIKT